MEKPGVIFILGQVIFLIDVKLLILVGCRFALVNYGAGALSRVVLGHRHRHARLSSLQERRRLLLSLASCLGYLRNCTYR